MVIYLDSSVLLAWVFGEPRRPPAELWSWRLLSSRLLTYETTSRVRAYRYGSDVEEGARAALRRVTQVSMTDDVLRRAENGFSWPVRTLDALHLATACHLRDHIPELQVATYDRRLADAATAVGLPLVTLPP